MPFNILLKPNSCQMNDLQYNNFYKPVEKVALYKKGGFFSLQLLPIRIFSTRANLFMPNILN